MRYPKVIAGKYRLFCQRKKLPITNPEYCFYSLYGNKNRIDFSIVLNVPCTSR